MKNKNILTQSYSLMAMVFLFLWFPISFNAQSDKREINIKAVSKLPDKSKRYALIIGVDEYQDLEIAALRGSANDAKLLAKSLIENAGFEADNVKVLATGEAPSRQPNRGNILSWLSRLQLNMPKEGLLLFSFSGHGIERDGRAYLLPSDAQIGGDISLVEETSINVEAVSERIRRSGIKQVMMILDACRNNPEGKGVEANEKTANKLTSAYTRGFNFEERNKEIEAFVKLYSTSVGQLAYEDKEKQQGYFTYAIVEGLKGAAANASGEVTLADLVRYVQEQVPRRIIADWGRDKNQKPFAEVKGYKADELVIAITAKAIVNTPVVTIDPIAIEMKLWDSVKDSKDPEDYRAYLEKYPNGTFSGVARNRIKQYEKAAKSTSKENSNIDNAAAKTNAPTIRDKVENSPPNNPSESLSSMNGETYLKAGDKMLSEKKWREAESEYRKALKSEPGQTKSHGKLGYALLRQEKWKEAESEIKIALADDPQNPYLHTNLGYALHRQQKFNEAEKEYKEAVKINPEEAILHGNLGAFLSQQQRLMEAEVEFKNALSLDPYNRSWKTAVESLIKEQGGEDFISTLGKLAYAADNNSELQKGVTSKPIALNSPRPNYTAEARAKAVEGMVMCRVLVNANGDVVLTKIVRGLPYNLNHQAVLALYQLKFKPALKDGKPVAYWVMIAVEFHMR